MNASKDRPARGNGNHLTLALLAAMLTAPAAQGQTSPEPPQISFAQATTTPLHVPGTLTLGGNGFAESTLQTGDFNKDGNLDLVIANPYVGFAPIIQLGNGDGTFRNGPVIDNSVTNWLGQSLLVGDFNGDANLDFAIAGASFLFLNLYLGDGTAHFSKSGTTLNFSAGQNDGYAQDVNGDGKDDLVVRNTFRIDVYFGNQAGILPLLPSVSTPALDGILLSSIRPANFNDDNVPDLVATSAANKVYVFLGIRNPVTGRGTGRFERFRYRPFAPPVLLWSDGDVAFSPFETREDTVGLVPGSGIAVDVNEDRIDDVIVFPEFNIVDVFPEVAQIPGIPHNMLSDYLLPGQFLKNAAVLVSKPGGGGFIGAKYYYGGLFPANSAVADFNKDGKPDFAASDVVGGAIVVQAGYGDGTFTNKTVDHTFFIAGQDDIPILDGFQQSIAIGDYNKDTKPDVATVGLSLIPNNASEPIPSQVFLSVLLNTSQTP